MKANSVRGLNAVARFWLVDLTWVLVRRCRESKCKTSLQQQEYPWREAL